MISSLSRFFRVREKKLLIAEDAEKSRGDRKEKQGRYAGLKHNFDRR